MKKLKNPGRSFRLFVGIFKTVMKLKLNSNQHLNGNLDLRELALGIKYFNLKHTSREYYQGRLGTDNLLIKVACFVNNFKIFSI